MSARDPRRGAGRRGASGQGASGGFAEALAGRPEVAEAVAVGELERELGETPDPRAEINYLTKDYASFRELLLSNLANLVPAWVEPSPVDLGIAVVEALAYAADFLSYHQDAVATEGYLMTARRRVSVRRHARLLEYELGEGTNARVWVTIAVDEAVTVPRRTPLLSQGSWLPAAISRATPEGERCLDLADYVFETVHSVNLDPRGNSIRIGRIGRSGRQDGEDPAELVLPAGSTRAVLLGDPPLAAGDVLIFEQVLEDAGEPVVERFFAPGGRPDVAKELPADCPGAVLTGPPDGLEEGSVLLVEQVVDAETGEPLEPGERRHWAAVLVEEPRASTLADGSEVTSVTWRWLPGKTPIEPIPVRVEKGGEVVACAVALSGLSVAPVGRRHPVRLTEAPRRLREGHLEVRWAAADALPFPLVVERRVGGLPFSDLAVARGNVVLADYGQEVVESLPRVEADRPYRPRLSRRPLTWREPYEDERERRRPAAVAARQAPGRVLPAVDLVESLPAAAGTVGWRPRRDLLESPRFSRHFVVETDEAGTAHLRFGDGESSRRPLPGSYLKAVYRVGNGAVGNVGPDTVRHLLTADPDLLDAVVAVRNPLPGTGGTDRETIGSARQAAPFAFHEQRRAVTAADYDALARRHPAVADASTRFVWTGSRTLALVQVLPSDGGGLDRELAASVEAWLAPFRLLGFGVEVAGPERVPVEVVLAVTAAPGHHPRRVEAELSAAFSSDLGGFFAPGRFGFGEPLAVASVVERARAVPGVAAVSVEVFRRFGEPSREALARGVLEVGPREIVHAGGSPEVPELGSVRFEVGRSG